MSCGRLCGVLCNLYLEGVSPRVSDSVCVRQDQSRQNEVGENSPERPLPGCNLCGAMLLHQVYGNYQELLAEALQLSNADSVAQRQMPVSKSLLHLNQFVPKTTET